jgi:hypothetical protein
MFESSSVRRATTRIRASEFRKYSMRDYVRFLIDFSLSYQAFMPILASIPNLPFPHPIRTQG